jgi:hypothetical protein
LKRLLLLLPFLLLSSCAQALEAIGTEVFLDRYWGVNTHLSQCCGGRYGNVDQTIADINYIGARRLRDWVFPRDTLLTRWQQIKDATGAPFQASIPISSPEAQRASFQAMMEWHTQSPDVIAGIEGSNESDVPYGQKMGASLQDSAELQKEVYAAGKQAGLRVAQMSVGWGWKPPHYEGNYKNFGKPPADYGNAHAYMNANESPSVPLRKIGPLAAWSVDGRPVMITEFGTYKRLWPNLSVLNGYMHIAPFAAYGLGYLRFMHYALYDDISGIVGFYDAHGNPRDFAHYWHRTARLLADPAGKGLPTKRINVTFVNQAPAPKGVFGIKNTALHKSDGSIWIASFNEQKPDGPTGRQTIIFDRKYRGLEVIDARTGKRIGAYRNANTVTIELPPNHLIFTVVSSSTRSRAL